MHFARWKFRRVQPANPTVLMKKHLWPAIWQDFEITAGFKMPEPSEAIFFWESWWSNFAIPHFTPSLKTINSTSRWMDCLIQRRSVYICWLVISSLRYSFLQSRWFRLYKRYYPVVYEKKKFAEDAPTSDLLFDYLNNYISSRRCTLLPQALVCKLRVEKTWWEEFVKRR